MFEKAKWIWNRSAEGSDNYVEFRTECEFQNQDSVLLRVSADTNYAVYLNGTFVDSGQYADYPHYKVYDEIDLSSHIVNGRNYLAFIVWYCGVPSFTASNGNHGLLFEVEQNGNIVKVSDEHIRSRKSRRYISGKNEIITPQLGLNFHVDLNHQDSWMTGNILDDFKPSIVVEGMPSELFPREIEKLVIEPRVPMKLAMQGTFSYLSENDNAGTKMQHAAMSFFRLKEMGQDDGEVIVLEKEELDGIYFILDLDAETAGYLDFDLEVPVDCQMEVGWGEHLEDGRCRTQISVRNYSVSVELHKGRNTYMNPFRRLGCRYLQFFVHSSKVRIHYAGLRPTVYPVKWREYHSGNILRDHIYAVSQNTLLQCMHEHYEDCPWREQAFYTLDSRNQMLCGYYAFEEYRFPRAGLRLISKSVREDGMLPICFPADSNMCIPSFTLFYIIQLAEYYQYSQDDETVKECFPCAEKIITAFIKQIDETGLVTNFEEEKEFWNFYEWQPYLNGSAYKGNVHDMCLNALFSLTIDSFMQLCEVMKIDTLSYLQLKEQINCKINEMFWDAKVGLYRLCDKPELTQYSVLANAWGYLCGAAKRWDYSKLLQVILENGTQSAADQIIPTTLSMNAFRYDALLLADRESYKDSILKEIDETYFYMLRKGATSFWETIKGDKDFTFAGSLCHGWAAMPIYYYEILSDDK